MFEEITDIINKLDVLEDAIEKLPSQLSIEDSKISDLYHILELKKLNSTQVWHLSKELKKVLLNRREIKNKMIIGNQFITIKGKLNNKDNRRMMLSELGRKNKIIHSKKFDYNQYSEEQLISLGILKSEEGASNEY